MSDEVLIVLEDLSLNVDNVNRQTNNDCRIQVINNYDFGELMLGNFIDLPENISTGVQLLQNSNNCVLNDDNFFLILEVAQYFKFHIIENKCQVHFFHFMINRNYIDALIICVKYFFSYKNTLNLAIRNVCKIFHQMSETDLFKLEREHIKLMLGWNYKFECNEAEILKTALKWMVNYEIKETKNKDLGIHLLDIIHSIHLDEITEEEIDDMTLSCDKISQACELLKRVKNDIQLDDTMKGFKNFTRSYGFPTVRGVEYALVKFDQSENLRMTCTTPANEKIPEWTKTHNIKIEGRVQDKLSIMFENNIFVFGNAINSEKTFPFALKYCAPVDAWLEVNTLVEGYELTSLNAIGNQFIGVGTFDRRTKMFAMKYDLKTDAWSEIEEMPVYLYQYASISSEDKLMISGGRSNNYGMSSKSMWMYTMTNVWTELPSMNYARSNHAMLKQKYNIYIIGGTDGCNAVQEVECYNILSRTFELLTTVPTPRFNAKYCLFHDKIFIKGGFEDFLQKKPELELFDIFDLISKKWTIAFNINIHYFMNDSIHMYKT